MFDRVPETKGRSICIRTAFAMHDDPHHTSRGLVSAVALPSFLKLYSSYSNSCNQIESFDHLHCANWRDICTESTQRPRTKADISLCLQTLAYVHRVCRAVHPPPLHACCREIVQARYIALPLTATTPLMINHSHVIALLCCCVDLG